MHESPGRTTRFAMPLIALVAAVPYIRSLRYPFVYDDGPIIANNAALHVPAGMLTAWSAAYWPAEWGRAMLFRPVVQFLYAALWSVSGGAPWLFHLYALVLYALCAIGVLLVLERALPTPIAILGALLFAADPLHVESVANVAGSAESVAALASIGCMLVIARAADRGGAMTWRDALVSAALFAIAFGAKESAVTVPAMAAIYIWGWRASSSSAAPSPRIADVLARGWRVWTACALALAIMLAARYTVLGGFSPPSTAMARGLEHATFAQRWWTMTAAWPIVAQLLLWPTRLSIYYGATTIIPRDGPTAVALASIAVIAAATIAAGTMAIRGGDRRPITAIAWIALAYVAASNLPVATGQLLAERTLFTASIGAVMLAAWALARAVDVSPGLGTPLTSGVLALCLVGTFASVGRVPVWSSEERLFQSGIDFDRAAYFPYQQLARAVGRAGDNARGLALLGDAYTRYPSGESLALEYAQHLRTSHRGEDALAILRTTARAHSGSQTVRLALLDALLDRRGADSVIREIRSSGADDPAGPLRFVILAHAYDLRGDTDSATAAYGRAVAASANDAGLRLAYATALHTSHRDASARAQLDSVTDWGAVPTLVHDALETRIDLALGDTAQARVALARARAAAPRDTTLSTLDSLLAKR